MPMKHKKDGDRLTRKENETKENEETVDVVKNASKDYLENE